MPRLRAKEPQLLPDTIRMVEQLVGTELALPWVGVELVLVTLTEGVNNGVANESAVLVTFWTAEKVKHFALNHDLRASCTVAKVPLPVAIRPKM